jgi:hypothetical protein
LPEFWGEAGQEMALPYAISARLVITDCNLP